VVENIFISNIDMINIPADAIRFNLFYGGQSPIPDSDQQSETTAEIAAVPVTEETPAFKRIFMTNIHAVNCGTAAYFQGLPEMMLEDIHLKNASFSTTRGITIIDAKNFEFENVKIDQKQETVMDIYNGVALSFDKMEDQSNGIVKISGTVSREISFENSNIGDDHIQCAKGLKPGAIKIVPGL
jgi:hypothetical protein